jgi:hypothetical protein
VDQAVLPLPRPSMARRRSRRPRRKSANTAATTTGGIYRRRTSCPCRTNGNTLGSPHGTPPFT